MTRHKDWRSAKSFKNLNALYCRKWSLSFANFQYCNNEDKWNNYCRLMTLLYRLCTWLENLIWSLWPTGIGHLQGTIDHLYVYCFIYICALPFFASSVLESCRDWHVIYQLCWCSLIAVRNGNWMNKAPGRVKSGCPLKAWSSGCPWL